LQFRCTTVAARVTRVRLCGRLVVEAQGRDIAAAVPGGQAAALFAYLVATHEAARDELIAALWPQRPPGDPGAALRPLLSRIRRALPDGATLAGRERLRLTLPEPVWVDVEAAATGVAGARAAAAEREWSRAAAEAEEAADLVRPGFLPGLDAEWASARRREVEELALEALELAARARLEEGDAGAA
jgi:DNA-binding SARP family transcriptional activator